MNRKGKKKKKKGFNPKERKPTDYQRERDLQLQQAGKKRRRRVVRENTRYHMA